MKTKKSFKLLLLFSTLLIFLETKAQKIIVVDFYNTPKKPCALIHSVTKKDYFEIQIMYNQTSDIEVNYKKKKIIYNSVTKSEGTAKEDLTKNKITITKSYIMSTDAFEFTIVVTDQTKNSNEITFIVYAKDYITVYPITGISFQKYKDYNSFHYEPINNSNTFHSDTIYSHKLKKDTIGWNSNIFIGTNFNYVINDWFRAGITTAFGINANKTSLSSVLLGGNFGFGRKIQFNIGGGFAFAKIKKIPEIYFQQEIKAKFSAPPKVPEGNEKWKSGFYLSFGIALAILEDN